MQLTLVTFMIGALAAPTLAAAQEPPIPPTPSVAPRPAAPAPAPRPAEAPRALVAPWVSLGHELDLIRPSIEFELSHQLDLMRPHLEDVRFHAEEARLFSEFARLDAVHAQAEVAAMARFDAQDVREQARHAAEVARMVERDAHSLMQPFGLPSERDLLLRARPREPWAQEDPADSLYRVAREALNRGEYRRAAQVFSEVTRKFPTSRYAQDSAYWEAFARYRIGTTDELKVALRILEGKGDGVPLQAEVLARSSRGSSIDIPALRARVQGALAARGDREAAAALQAEAAQRGESCDREEVSVRAEALNALGQMDMAAAMPTVRRVLARRDECTVELRRRALYLVGRQPGPEATTIVLDVARNDTDAGIRGEAMRWLPRVAGDAAIPQLEDLLRTATDERTQRSAVTALGAIDNDRARRAIRTIIERNDAAERVRTDAILSLSRERDGRTPSAEEMAYLRSLYAKMQTPRLREAVLTSVSRVAAADNEQFLLGIARNVAETASLRAAAIQRLGRMQTVDVADIGKLYDVADSRAMREQILSALSQRKEPAAIDRMIEIARKDTDPQIRRYAVNLLARSNNDRAKQFITGMFEP